MARKWKFILLSIFTIGAVGAAGCLLIYWVPTLVIVDDYYHLNQREHDDEHDLAAAFTIALRKNHPSAYEMVDPALIPRLDEWMNTHQVPECVRRTEFIGGGLGEGTGVSYSCRTKTGGYGIHLEVVIEDMKVTDWKVHDESY